MKEMICIQCPMGCHLKVDKKNDELIVTGNTCPRGKAYAQSEIMHPCRTLTTTVKINGSNYERLPVISSQPIEKEMIFDVVRSLKLVEVEAPIMRNDIIVKNICGTNVDIVASKTMNRR